VKNVATSDPLGGIICFDGNFTHEVCNVDITSPMPGCQTFQSNTQGNVTTCDLITAVQNESKTIVQAGDSGGPVETTLPNQGQGSQARGIIIGLLGTSSSATGYYLPQRIIDAEFGMTVLTS
jgi:hypothetical protein